ncbi:glutathione-independent formaldehyde dehydrogenase [Burkholderia anthina]|uniref:Glutathione-independent formaldehyde dehydrogenase n=1 Tax=Burkholderia anthina TaxID=179879 RepID=A0A6P2GGF6_9BURK|nr:hypothetical protein [Burkholderia anthina]VVU52356.1 glutathione-independent formaldehyde dehydrogenase [Burkholderia anthina]
MSGNRGVVYVGPGKVEVRGIAFPEPVDPSGRKANHGVIPRVVATHIRGSDQHMVSGVPKQCVIDPHGSLKAAA